jgi:glycosyltransferase involved in cell wall biosynthesis
VRPSTVIIVSDYASVTGGNGAVALSSAVGLARSGIRTIVFAATGPISNELLGVDGLDVVCMESPDFLSDPVRSRGALRGLWDFDAAKMIGRILVGCDPATTVVHVHSWTKALSASVIAAARSAGFSIVVTLHDYFAFCPNGSLYDHEKQAPCLLRPMGAKCITANCDPRSRVQKAYRVARQAVANRFAQIPAGVKFFICVSAYSREVAAPNLGTSTIFDVRNPIEAERESPADPGANSEFVYVGRISREKGTDIFAMASKIANVPATFVGDGPFRDVTLETAPSAAYTGWLSREAVRARLRTARALVLPSRWYEASPLVVPEAAAIGIPAIVSDGCAAIDAIVDGVTGLKFRSGDAGDLAAKMSTLNPELASAMGRAAYERFWSDPPLMATHVEALNEVYSTILGRRSGAMKKATVPVVRRRAQKSQMFDG